MQAAEHFGAITITLRDDSVKAKVQLLPVDGIAYGVFAFVESILLLNEPQSSKRLSLTQRLMINPMVRSAAAELIAVQDEAIARYTAESASEFLEPEQRCASSKKAAHQRNLRGALNRASESPENYILVATQPLQSFPCLDALDATVQLMLRDDSNRDASQRRSSLGWAFARESPIATAIVRGLPSTGRLPKEALRSRRCGHSLLCIHGLGSRHPRDRSSGRWCRHQETNVTRGHKGTPTHNTTDKPLHSTFIGPWPAAADVACSCNALWCGIARLYFSHPPAL